MEDAMIRRGELWRLVTSIFPHVDVLHLIFNLYWLWVFGTLVEQVYGHFKTAALILLFAVGPSALEYAFSSGGVGLSGVGYGLFGVLWILSKRDERFRDAVDQRTIQLFVIWFFFCILATATNFMRVGNIAHGAGGVLGILTGFSLTMPKRRVPITAGIGLLLGVSLWAATIGRSKVNFSAYASYDECKRGYDAMKAGHNQEALQWFQSAAAYHYNQAPCFTSLGYVSHNLDRFTESVDAYRRAAKMGDEDSEFYLGKLYEKGEAGLPKDAQQAMEWYRKAAEYGSPEILNNVAWAMETSSDPSIRDIPGALGYAHKAVNADKDHPKPYILDTLAYAYFLNQQFEEAIKTEQRASQLAGSEEKKEYLAKIKIYQLALKVERKLPKRDKESAKGN
ncbi:MAG TPA: rhomboid family intramembrane serine protease [Candidatus Angelobacter sp.]